MNNESVFFANFSLRELVNLGHPSLASLGRGIGGGVPGGFPGGVAGGIGASGGFVGSGPSSYRRFESLSFSAAPEAFDEPQFIRSLKSGVENQIVDSAAAVTNQGNIEGGFNTSEFYFEYSQADIRGRILISGKLVGSNYCLRADIEEIGEGPRFPFPADEFAGIRPESDYYYVVPFKDGDPWAEDNKLHVLGVQLIQGARQRLRRLSKSDIENLQCAEVWSLYKLPPHIKHLLQEQGREHIPDLSGEYKEYRRVCFLNELALGMYRDGGVALEVLKKISPVEMPPGCSRSLRGPYVPD